MQCAERSTWARGIKFRERERLSAIKGTRVDAISGQPKTEDADVGLTG